MRVVIIFSVLLTIVIAGSNGRLGVLYNQDENLAICDRFQMAQFPSNVTNQVNCSSFATLLNGFMVCNDAAPNLASDSLSGAWQFAYQQEQIVFTDDGTIYNLYYCGECSTDDCDGRTGLNISDIKNPDPCTGTFKAFVNGAYWKCIDPTCSGYMQQLANGSYKCIDGVCDHIGTSYVQYYDHKWQCFDPACDNMTNMGGYWQCNSAQCDDGPYRENEGWACKNWETCPQGTLYYNSAQKRYICTQYDNFLSRTTGLTWLAFFITMTVMVFSVGSGCYTCGVQRKKRLETRSLELEEKTSAQNSKG